MIDALRLTAGWALVWLFGVGIAGAMLRSIAHRSHGEGSWTIGCGFFAGAFVITLWMRTLSLIGLQFSLASIALPIVLATAALAVFAWRSPRTRTATPPAATLSRGQRLVMVALLAWLGFRFVLLLLEVIWTPLYPWDAWIQWATKARVWYALGHIVPFGRTEAWFAANGAIWFDASPNYPATIPLWQVWSSVALGRWDDALMNLPWWLASVAFAVAVHGALRMGGVGALGAVAGAWLVSSLPLANVHVALAGYADLPMAAYFALAALSVWRWSQARTLANATLALLLAVACMTIKTPGLVWALTLLPGVVLALMPQRGSRVVAAALVVMLAVLAVLAQTAPVVLGYRLHLDFAPPWAALIDSLFLLGNWHLLWYAVIAGAVLARYELRTPALSALSATVGAGVLFLVIAFSFTNARNWVTDQTTVNRAILHIAPLALVWTILIVHAWLARRRSPASPALTPAEPTVATAEPVVASQGTGSYRRARPGVFQRFPGVAAGGATHG